MSRVEIPPQNYTFHPAKVLHMPGSIQPISRSQRIELLFGLEYPLFRHSHVVAHNIAGGKRDHQESQKRAHHKEKQHVRETPGKVGSHDIHLQFVSCQPAALEKQTRA